MGGLLLLLCKQLLLPLQLDGEGTTNRAPALFVSVIPEAVVAMPTVRPTRMIEDRIQADSVQGHTRCHRDAALLSNVAQPTRAPKRLRSRFGDQHRALVALIDLRQHLVERAIPRIGVRNHFAL